jgi:hypothetical protein
MFKNINWRKWKILLLISIAVPMGTILMGALDSQMYEVDIFNDIYYMYLSQINLVLWACLYFIVDMWSKQKVTE